MDLILKRFVTSGRSPKFTVSVIDANGSGGQQPEFNGL